MQRSEQEPLITNIGLLATPSTRAVKGENQGKVRFLQDVYIKIKDGFIAEIGSNYDLDKDEMTKYHVLDAEGSLVTPGLVDPHTH